MAQDSAKLQVDGEIREMAVISLIDLCCQNDIKGAQPIDSIKKRHLYFERVIPPPPKHGNHVTAQSLYGPL